MSTFISKIIAFLQRFQKPVVSEKPDKYKILYEEVLKQNSLLEKRIEASLIGLKYNAFSKQEKIVLLKSAEVMSMYLENVMISLVNLLSMTEEPSKVLKIIGGLTHLYEARVYFVNALETGKLPVQSSQKK